MSHAVNQPRRPSGYRADRGMSHADIEEVMLGVRRILDPQTMPHQPLPMLRTLEHLHRRTAPAKSRKVKLCWGVSELPWGVEGRTRYEDEYDHIVIEVSQRTYDDLEQGNSRAITTVAHEIAHSFLHTDQLIRISHIPHLQMALERASGPAHQYFEDTEWQANVGAAALTMPAQGLAALERKFTLTPEVIRMVFGVSEQAAMHRLDSFRRRRAELLTKKPLKWLHT